MPTGAQQAGAAEAAQKAEAEAAEPSAAQAPAAATAGGAVRVAAAAVAPGAEAPSAPAVSTPASPHVTTATGLQHLGGLVSAYEQLTGGSALLRALVLNRRYSFHLHSGELMMGIIRERIGGPWIVVDIGNARKMLNLEQVEYCEAM
jgi:hypothetical protein